MQRPCAQRGQASAEYLGVVVVVAALVAGLAATGLPARVFAKGRGFNYSAIVNSVGDLVVGGTTPCFPPNETE